MQRRIIIFGHIIFWIAYTALLYSVFYSLFSARSLTPSAWKPTLLFLGLHIPMAYFNMQFLIPRFYLKKKYILYSLICIVLIAATVVIFQSALFELNSPPPNRFPFTTQPNFGPGSFDANRPMPPPSAFRFRGFMELSMSLSILLLSSVMKISQIANRKERETEQLRSENFNSELKFLKSQINPHFLFNTLNNIYALSLLKSDKTPDTVLRLSEMLRYVLYECSITEKVPVSKEVIYIRNYIALQLLRDSKIKNVNFTTDIDRDVEVAPMIFIPFVENAFKHSKIENITEGWITITLTARSNNVILIVENNKPRTGSAKDTTGGIGIDNVTKRLKLLYPGNHFLEIKQNETSYKVSLELLV